MTDRASHPEGDPTDSLRAVQTPETLHPELVRYNAAAKRLMVEILGDGHTNMLVDLHEMLEGMKAYTGAQADALAASLREKCPDVQTAHALAVLIRTNKVPSPWRDAGLRLYEFGKWLAALAREEKQDE